MSDKNNKKNNKKSKTFLGLALFALLFASKDKINKKLEEKKEEIAKEQWTKKNSVTLISMQELEERLEDEEQTLDMFINAEEKEIKFSDIKDHIRFPSDSEGVSYLEGLYILPYINENDNVLIREFSMSYVDKDTFYWRDKKNEIYKQYDKYNFFIFDTKNIYQPKYNYSDLYNKQAKAHVSIVNDDENDEPFITYTKRYNSDIMNAEEGKEWGYTYLGKFYRIVEEENFTTDSSKFSLEEGNKRLFYVPSFGFKKNPYSDIGLFFFIPFGFYCPKMEKGRNFTFEKLYIDNIVIQTENEWGGLNNGLNVLSLLNNKEFKSDEIMFSKKNQIDLLNFIKKDYIITGENNFIFPIPLYFPIENFVSKDNVGLYAFSNVNIHDLFFAYYYLMRNGYFFKNNYEIDDLKDNSILNYVLEGVKKIKQISFSIHYNFNELNSELTNYKIIYKFGEMEDKVDYTKIGDFEITIYSTKYPEIQKGYGISNNFNIGDIFVDKVEKKDYDNEFFFSTQYVFQDETIRNYQNNFSEDFNYWINHNIVFNPVYSDNDVVEYNKLK